MDEIGDPNPTVKQKAKGVLHKTWTYSSEISMLSFWLVWLRVVRYSLVAISIRWSLLKRKSPLLAASEPCKDKSWVRERRGSHGFVGNLTVSRKLWCWGTSSRWVARTRRDTSVWSWTSFTGNDPTYNSCSKRPSKTFQWFGFGKQYRGQHECTLCINPATNVM